MHCNEQGLHAVGAEAAQHCPCAGVAFPFFHSHKMRRSAPCPSASPCAPRQGTHGHLRRTLRQAASPHAAPDHLSSYRLAVSAIEAIFSHNGMPRVTSLDTYLHECIPTQYSWIAALPGTASRRSGPAWRWSHGVGLTECDLDQLRLGAIGSSPPWILPIYACERLTVFM